MHLKREVIRGHQWQSFIISSRVSSVPRGNQWQSVAISVHQCPSVSISVHQWQSVAISGNQWQSVSISGSNQCQSGANMHLHVQCDVSEDATILELEGPMKRAKLAHVDEREHTPS